MVHSSATRIDPAADAALLLRRLGFAILFLVMPIAAVISRRAAVVLMPVGATLMILAAILEPGEMPFGARLASSLRSPLLWMVIGLGLWALLSLTWTPAPRQALDRIANLAGMLVLLVGVCASLPAKVRAPLLYMLPIGVFSAAAAASVVILGSRYGFPGYRMTIEPTTLQRGLATLVLLSAPAAGWLLSRGRVIDAALMAVALMAVAFTAQDELMAIAVSLAALAYLLMRLKPALAVAMLALLLGLIAAVALLPLFIKGWQGQTIAGIQLMPLFSGSFLRRLGRLVTGYGLETTPRMAAGNYFLPFGPTYFAGLWFDLGLVAIGLIGAGMIGSFRAARAASVDVAAAVLALMVVIGVQGAAMPASYQAWWLSSVIAAVTGVAAIARGQGRTRRPGIRLFGPVSAAPGAQRPKA